MCGLVSFLKSGMFSDTISSDTKLLSSPLPPPALEPLVESLFYGTPSLFVLLLLAPWPYKVDLSHKRTVLSWALRMVLRTDSSFHIWVRHNFL